MLNWCLIFFSAWLKLAWRAPVSSVLYWSSLASISFLVDMNSTHSRGLSVLFLAQAAGYLGALRDCVGCLATNISGSRGLEVSLFGESCAWGPAILFTAALGAAGRAGRAGGEAPGPLSAVARSSLPPPLLRAGIAVL